MRLLNSRVFTDKLLVPLFIQEKLKKVGNDIFSLWLIQTFADVGYIEMSTVKGISSFCGQMIHFFTGSFTILLCSTASNLSIKLNRIAWYKQLHAIKSCTWNCWTNYTRQRDPFEHKLTTKFKKAAKLIELSHRFPSSIINIFLFMWDNFTIIISLVNRK